MTPSLHPVDFQPYDILTVPTLWMLGQDLYAEKILSCHNTELLRVEGTCHQSRLAISYNQTGLFNRLFLLTGACVGYTLQVCPSFCMRSRGTAA